MTLNSIKPNPLRNKTKRRVGRGNGSGAGTYSCKGMKGQTARTGGRRRPGFEGGQMPLIRRMPKIGGFKCPTRIAYQVINIEKLNVFNDNDTVDQNSLLEKKIIRKKNLPVKILGHGELTKALTISVAKVSSTAAEKITKAKGKIVEPAAPKKTNE